MITVRFAVTEEIGITVSDVPKRTVIVRSLRGKMTVYCANEKCGIAPTTYKVIRGMPYCLKCSQLFFEQEVTKLKKEFGY